MGGDWEHTLFVVIVARRVDAVADFLDERLVLARALHVGEIASAALNVTGQACDLFAVSRLLLMLFFGQEEEERTPHVGNAESWAEASAAAAAARTIEYFIFFGRGGFVLVFAAKKATVLACLLAGINEC